MTVQPITLAILVHDLSASGVVGNAIRIAGHMAGSGMATELWTVRGTGPFRARIPAGVGVVEFGGANPWTNRRLSTLLAAPAIAQAILARQPSVLLSAGNHFHLAAGLAYRLAGRPAATRLIGRASNATPRFGRRLPGLAILVNAADALKYRELTHVVAVSRELASDLESKLGIAPARISVIPNGVDVAAVARLAEAPLDDPWFAAGEPPVVVSAGRLSRQKNYGLLLAAFALLRKARAARLIILGDGSPAWRAALDRQALRLGINADFRLAGFDANPMRYFARSGIFVLSSLWEGASNVILEALACGCPVVATDCPSGVREQLDNGRIGPIVPPGDAAALAQAMARRLDAPRDSSTLKEYAGSFDHSIMLGAYGRLIETMALCK